jgi:hypothetical protein
VSSKRLRTTLSLLIGDNIIMEILKTFTISELYRWCEKNKNISWNECCDLFDFVPYRGNKKIMLCDCYEFASGEYGEDYEKQYKLIHEFLNEFNVKEDEYILFYCD